MKLKYYKHIPTGDKSPNHELSESIKQLGTTFIKFTFLNGQSGNYSNELKIFGKQGKPCEKCSNKIKKIKINFSDVEALIFFNIRK